MKLFTLVIVIFAGAAFADQGFWNLVEAPKDISVDGYGSLIDSLFNYITFLNVFYFTLVCAGIFGFSYLYHHKKHPKPYYTYGNKKKHLQVTLVIGLAVFFTIDTVIAYRSNQDLMNVFWNWPDPAKENVLRVQVQGQQWVWNFRYAGADGQFNTIDDVMTVNDLRIPAGRKVLFQLTAKDVIHSLYFPNMRVKVDAMPGRVSRMWVQTKDDAMGTYDIACAEMCGTYHYRMQAKLTVLTEQDFEAWQTEARQIAVAANDEENPDLFWGWKWE